MIAYYDPVYDEIVLRFNDWHLFETKHFPAGNLYWRPPYYTCGGWGPKLIRLGEL